MLGTYTPPNPWVWSANDPQGLSLTCTVQWNSKTNALRSASVVRQTGCTLANLYFGTGPDGTPNSAPGTFAAPVGTTNVTSAQLSSGGLNVITDVTALQITAGP